MVGIYDAFSNRLVRDPGIGENTSAGFALLVVLWMMGILSLIAISVSYSVRFEVRSSANISNRVKSEYLADGFARLIIANVAESREFRFGSQPLASGIPFACRYSDRIIVATATDTKGLVDINAGDPGQIESLLMATGLTKDKARELQIAIKDYRDPDNEVTGGGEETDRYASGGLIHLPKNGPFESIEELDQVYGMPVGLVTILRQYLTVRSYERMVFTEISPLLLRHALNGDSPDLAGIIGHADKVNADRRDAGSGYSFTPNSRAFELRVMVAEESGSNAIRHSVAELTPGYGLGFSLLQWQKLPASRLESLMAQAAAIRPCF